MKSIRFFGLGLGIVPSLALPCQPDEATDLLRRSMEQAKQIPVVAICHQRSIGGPSAAIQVKIEQSRDGITNLTILQPLSMGGRHVRRRRQELEDLSARQAASHRPGLAPAAPPELRRAHGLAQDNYRFKMEPTVTIAGRRAVPSSPSEDKDMATRKYFVDQETASCSHETTSPANGDGHSTQR